jgi:hypothetical protein
MLLHFCVAASRARAGRKLGANGFALKLIAANLKIGMRAYYYSHAPPRHNWVESLTTGGIEPSRAGQ